MNTAVYWIKKLGLRKHPEGGWFKEVYRSDDLISPHGFEGERNCSTSIFYLLEGEDYSSFHRIRSDEIWHFYTGSSGVEILWIEDGNLITARLGADFDNDEQFQLVVPKNCWFAARLADKNGFALVGCTVAPGFHFDDFQLSDASLIEEFPALKSNLKELIRK